MERESDLLAAARVEAGERLLGDALEHVLREGAEEAPRDLERVEDRAVLVRPLVDELRLELLEELEVEVVLEGMEGRGGARERRVAGRG